MTYAVHQSTSYSNTNSIIMVLCSVIKNGLLFEGKRLTVKNSSSVAFKARTQKVFKEGVRDDKLSECLYN